MEEPNRHLSAKKNTITERKNALIGLNSEMEMNREEQRKKSQNLRRNK